MRESKITYEQVAAIAEKLKEQGEDPTARAIKHAIGPGCTKLILRYKQQWEKNENTQSKYNDSILDPEIIKAINTTIESLIQKENLALTTKVAGLQLDLNDLILENEHSENIIESQNVELVEMRAEYSTLTGRLQQVEKEAGLTMAELNSERHSLQALSITLAKSELRLEAVPKIEDENLKLRSENESNRIKVAEIMQSEAVAVTKMQQAQQYVLEAKESATKTNQILDALREKYEQLQGSAIEKERTSAKLLENERLTSQSLQSKLESVTRELKLAHLSAQEARAATQKALGSPAKSDLPQKITKTISTDPDILDFTQTDTGEINELEVLDIT